MTRADSDWHSSALAAEWIDEQDRMDRMLSPYSRHILAGADLQAGETVIDVGCGTGSLTLAAWDRVQPAGRVTGLDLSPEMLAAARIRCGQAVPTLQLIRADAATHPLPTRTLDAVISRFGMGHFTDTAAAMAHLAVALRPGGRLVFAEWAISEPNEWMTLVCDVARSVLGREDRPRAPEHTRQFAAQAKLHAVLAQAGLRDIRICAVQEPLWVGRSVSDVLAWFSRLQDSRFLGDLELSDRHRYLLALGAELDRRATADGVYLRGTAWVAHATAR
jgi:ubiquinone/menaquinone biosynthesis C-methylase UbiE